MKRFLFILGFVISFSLGFSLGCCIQNYQVQNPAKIDLVKHLERSTVALIEPTTDNKYRSFCSGVWINETHILTARHCVVENPIIGAQKSDLKQLINYQMVESYAIPPEAVENVYTAIVIAISDKYDIAVMKSIDDVKHNIAEIAQYKKIPTGLDVHIYGHPLNYRYTYLEGTVAATRVIDYEFLFEHKQLVLQITTHTGPGNSGGGAFDNEGRLVGICSFSDRRVDGLHFFIHRNVIQSFLEDAKIKYY